MSRGQLLHRARVSAGPRRPGGTRIRLRLEYLSRSARSLRYSGCRAGSASHDDARKEHHRRVAAIHGKSFWIQAPGRGRRVLQAVAVLGNAVGTGIDQSTRVAAIRLLLASVGGRPGATARVRELVIAVSALYKPRRVRREAEAPTQ